MFTAPPIPPQEPRRGRLFRVLSGLGLGAAAALLLVINLVLFLATAYFVATPEGLYHRVWQSTAEHIYDPADLHDWKQWEHKYDGKLTTDEEAARAITEMLDSVKDRYTYFMDASAVDAENDKQQGNFVGVGMVFGVQTDGQGQPVQAADGKPLPEVDANGHPVIKRVMDDGPAKAAGLKPGDAIISVDGADTKGMSLDQLITKVRGAENTPVTFGVRSNGVDSTLTVTRASINIPAVTTKHLTNGIGYLRLEDFGQLDATDEFKKGLNDLKDCKALVIDLRGNPGGFVFNAINMASLFIEEGTVVQIRSRIPGDPATPQYETQTVRLTKTRLIEETSDTRRQGRVVKDEGDRQPYLAAQRPVVILVDGNSASASEMFTGALKDNGVATVVGERTFGKGIGQSSIPMPNGTQLHVTSLRYFTPNGTWLGDGGNTQAHGIEPHVEVKANPGLQFGENNDNQLQEAIQLLNQKLGGKSERPFFRTQAALAG